LAKEEKKKKKKSTRIPFKPPKGKKTGDKERTALAQKCGEKENGREPTVPESGGNWSMLFRYKGKKGEIGSNRSPCNKGEDHLRL